MSPFQSQSKGKGILKIKTDYYMGAPMKKPDCL